MNPFVSFASEVLLFLEAGGLVPFPPGAEVSSDFWIGWGQVSRTAEGPKEIGSSRNSSSGGWFYAPDFFLEDPRPWWSFSSGARVSRQRLLEILEQAASQLNLDRSEPAGASVRAPGSEVDPRLFSEIFVDLKSRLERGELTKGVPYVFQDLGPSIGTRERLLLLIQLLRKTQGEALHVYGVWDSEEGILGATPEILFSQSGSQFETVALAGTRLNGVQTSSLLDDPKERVEHQIVVDGILSSLKSSFAEGMTGFRVGDLHELQLPALTHLCTPISFQLDGGALSSWQTFQNLVKALHPTPALGAFPRQAGLQWLTEVQGKIPRGRFGAPFGVVVTGVGKAEVEEMVPHSQLSAESSLCLVAIRNLQWDSQQARIGAGCGVVGASELGREWKEIQGKLSAVRNLLGVSAAGLNIARRSDAGVSIAMDVALNVTRQVPLSAPQNDSVSQTRPLGPNLKLAQEVLEELFAWGVRELCVCPGARNAPWIALLSANPDLFKTYYHFEERSAAFFALGRIRQTGLPMAVLTTSGTAVGELLPAAMEAYYSGFPLILLTADRPRYYRNSGAPQTAEQVGIFGTYTPHTFDLEAGSASGALQSIRDLALTQPVHVNACFDEPLIDGLVPTLNFGYLDPTKLTSNMTSNWAEPIPAEVQDFFGQVRSPLVLVGMLHSQEKEAVYQLLLRLDCPVYLEATSGLREDRRLQHLRNEILAPFVHVRLPFGEIRNC